MTGLRQDCFSSKRSSRKAPRFPSSNYLLTNRATHFLVNVLDPSSVQYSTDDPQAGECILISPALFGKLAQGQRFSIKFGYHILLTDVLNLLVQLKSGVGIKSNLALCAKLNHITALLRGIHKECYSTGTTKLPQSVGSRIFWRTKR